MTPYYVLIGAISVLCSLNLFSLRSKEGRLFLYILIVFVLIIFAGFRSDDPDYWNYKAIYESVCHNHQSRLADPGFNAILNILAGFDCAPVFMFFSVAAIAVSLNAVSIYRYTPYFFAALLLYFCHNFCLKEMIQIRVGLASAICVFSLYYLYHKRLKTFWILLCCAVSVHLTTIVFILAYLTQKYLTRKQLLYCVGISLVIGLLFPFGAILKTYIGIDHRLDSYIAYGNDGYAQSLGIFGNLNAMKCLIIFAFLYYFYDSLNSKNRYFRLLFSSYSAGLCWLLLFNDFAIIGARISNILLSVEPILLTYPFGIFKQGSKWIYLMSLIILAIIMFNMNIAPSKVTPYHFYF